MHLVLDRSDREDVRLHQPRCANSSAFDPRGYVDNTLPSRCYASPLSCVCVGFFLKLLRSPTTCTRQPSSGSPTRVSAMAYVNTQVSSPGLSPIQVPSTGILAEVSTYGPERCEQGSRDTKRAPGTPCHVPTASQPTPRSALSTASSILQHQKLLATPGQRTRVIKKPRGSIGFGPNAW